MFNTESSVMYYAYLWSPSNFNGTFDVAINSIPVLANDVCSSATPIAIGTSVKGNLTFAASDVSEVAGANSCANTVISPYETGLWYSFQGTGRRVWVTTCVPDRVSMTFSMAFSVYKGSCGPANLFCVAGGFASCDLKFTFQTDLGTTYYLLVSSAASNQAFDLRITNEPAVSVGNDLCINAAPISIGSSVQGNVTGATTDEGDAPGDCLAGNPLNSRRDLWYRFNGTGAVAIINTCWGRESMSADVSLYKESCGKTSLKCVDGSYNTCIKPQFTVHLNCTYTEISLFVGQYEFSSIDWNNMADINSQNGLMHIMSRPLRRYKSPSEHESSHGVWRLCCWSQRRAKAKAHEPFQVSASESHTTRSDDDALLDDETTLYSQSLYSKTQSFVDRKAHRSLLPTSLLRQPIDPPGGTNDALNTTPNRHIRAMDKDHSVHSFLKQADEAYHQLAANTAMNAQTTVTAKLDWIPLDRATTRSFRTLYSEVNDYSFVDDDEMIPTTLDPPAEKACSSRSLYASQSVHSRRRSPNDAFPNRGNDIDHSDPFIPHAISGTEWNDISTLTIDPTLLTETPNYQYVEF